MDIVKISGIEYVTLADHQRAHAHAIKCVSDANKIVIASRDVEIARRDAKIADLEATLRFADKALSGTLFRCGVGYDWNADRDNITFLAGESFAKTKKVLDK